MRRTFPFALASAVVLAVALAALTACSHAADRSLPAEGESGAGSTDGAASESGRTFESTAMVVTFGDGEILFVGESDGPYYPGLDNAEIIGIDGAPITAADLVAGNTVRVTGNGIMLESYPGQYPGVTKVEVIDEGTPEDAAQYDYIVAEIWQPRDPSEPANAQIEYRTDLDIVTMAIDRLSLTWDSEEEDGTRMTVHSDGVHPTQIAPDAVATATIDAPVEATISFDLPAKSIYVERWNEETIAEARQTGEGAELDLEGESVDATFADGVGTFEIEPGWRYWVHAFFAAGDVEYAFSVA